MVLRLYLDDDRGNLLFWHTSILPDSCGLVGDGHMENLSCARAGVHGLIFMFTYVFSIRR